MKEQIEYNAQAFLDDESITQPEKYALLVAGSRSFWWLLYSETVTGICSNRPGAFGYFIRQKTYRSLFKAAGRKLLIGKNVTIRGSKNIVLGDHVFIDDNCVLDARGAEASIIIEKNTFVSRNTIIRARNGEIVIDEGADIGCNCILGTDSRLHIGANALLSAYTYIAGAATHQFSDPKMPIIRQGPAPSRGGVRIGANAWLGARTTVLDGVTIGEGTVVGAHSLVNRSLPEMCLAFGVPARVQKYRR